ncbi:MAG: LysR substrate-binding domain-containing protein [Plesiomonas shigelloides]
MYNITLRQLSFFVNVVDTGSTSGAAAKLSVTQSAISAGLSELELNLNVSLFDRIGKRLVINENGRLLYPKANELLAQTGGINDLFMNSNSNIYISATPCIADSLLPKIIHDYHYFSDGYIDLHVGPIDEVVYSVVNSKTALGFVNTAVTDSNLVSYPWYEDELVVFTSQAYLEELKNVFNMECDTFLTEAPWILRNAESGIRRDINKHILSTLPQINIAMEIGSSELIIKLIKSMGGLSCLPKRLIVEELLSGELVRLKCFDTIMTRLFIIHHKNKGLSKKLADLLVCCQKIKSDIFNSDAVRFQ